MKEKILNNSQVIITIMLSLTIILTNITIIRITTHINTLNKKINEQQTEIDSLKNRKNSNGIIIEFGTPRNSETI